VENYRISSESYETRVSTVVAIDSFIEDYAFDRVKEESCTLKLKVTFNQFY